MKTKNLFIISGPSGSGQDSVIEKLKEIIPIQRVITTTTRPMRPTESQGNPYFFVSREEFEKMIDEERLAEYAREYNDNYYGVTKEELERVSGGNVLGIWKMEYQGVITAKAKYPGIKAILIAPESLEIVEQRIRNRDKNASDEFIRERMGYTEEFLKHENIYDFKVINYQGKLDETVAQVAQIIRDNH
jgi:guanylate kinase